jgi:hypothetical protein
MKFKPILIATLAALPIHFPSASAQIGESGVFLGQLSTNPYLTDST